MRLPFQTPIIVWSYNCMLLGGFEFTHGQARACSHACLEQRIALQTLVVSDQEIEKAHLRLLRGFREELGQAS